MTRNIHTIYNKVYICSEIIMRQEDFSCLLIRINNSNNSRMGILGQLVEIWDKWVR